MTASQEHPSDLDIASRLRQRAEAQLAGDALPRSEDMSPEEMKKLIHELRVHQIELEMQADELRRSQHALELSQARYFDLYDLAPVGYLTVSATGIIQEANLTACTMLGIPRKTLLGSPISKIIAPADQDIYYQRRKRLLESEVAETFELTFQRAGGTNFWALCNAHSTSDAEASKRLIRLTLSDVSERKEIERQMSALQRLQSLGTLAAGIAHDFNNLLTGLFGYLELIKEQSKPSDPISELINKAFVVFQRTRLLTQQMLTFAKGGAPVTKALDLNTLLREATAFALTGSPIAADFRLAENLPPIEGDAGQLKQVVENLLINAKQAMPAGGVITITSERHLPQCLRFSITDRGCGIPPEIMPRIFDPFFTTKPQGHGLGLAMTHSIVTRHGGKIHATSLLSEGTTFTVSLPVSASALSVPVPPPVTASISPTRVLIMDDEPTIRELTQSMLRLIKCRPMAVGSGEEAIRAYADAAREGDPFGLVILDLTIPGGLGGMETLNKLRELDPAVRALVSSGYSDSPIMATPAAYGFSGSLAKPYRFAELKEKVAVALRTAADEAVVIS